MPWKDTDAVKERIAFVMRALSKEMPFVELCREYRISPKTGYKWKERFVRMGKAGLCDEPRRPSGSPLWIDEDQWCAIVSLKCAHERWGPKKIHELLGRKYPRFDAASLSTVKRILKKTGLVEERRRRRAQECGRIENRRVAQAPNEVWTTDFKGHWYSAERKRVQPLTVQDAYSRYVLCAEAVPDSRTETVQKCFERLFEKYGLPGTMQSDNGPPFASMTAPLGLTRLSAWWVSLGINLDRIRPGHPEENGKHERMHRDLAAEVEQKSQGRWEQQQPELDMWTRERNEERPHEALGLKMPAEVYKKSARRWKKGGVKLEYPEGYLTRSVTECGYIKINGRSMRITEALGKCEVGLQMEEKETYKVWFGPLCLGRLNLETEALVPE